MNIFSYLALLVMIFILGNKLLIYEGKINALIKDLRKEYLANGNYLSESKVIATFMAHDIDHTSLTNSEWNKIKKRITN